MPTQVPTLRRISVEKIEDVTVVTFNNQIFMDPGQIQDLRIELSSLIDGQSPRILLDCSNVDFFCAAACGALVTLHKKVQEAQGHLRFCALQQAMHEALAIMKLHLIFSIFPDRTSALASFP